MTITGWLLFWVTNLRLNWLPFLKCCFLCLLPKQLDIISLCLNRLLIHSTHRNFPSIKPSKTTISINCHHPYQSINQSGSIIQTCANVHLLIHVPSRKCTMCWWHFQQFLQILTPLVSNGAQCLLRVHVIMNARARSCSLCAWNNAKCVGLQ